MDVNQKLLLLIGLFFICGSNVGAIREEDLIIDLPNVTFSYSFKHYSGYVNANADASWKMFYWLTEAMDSPETKPLIIWVSLKLTRFKCKTFSLMEDPDVHRLVVC